MTKKSIREIVELKAKKYHINFASIFIGKNEAVVPDYVRKIEEKLKHPVILTSYLDSINWLAFSEFDLIFSNSEIEKKVPLSSIAFCKVDMLKEIEEGKSNKRDFGSVYLVITSGERFRVSTETNGVGFFLSDIITIAADKSRA